MLKMRPAFFLLLCILNTLSSAVGTSDSDAADNPFAEYTSWEGESLNITMLPGMQPFKLSANSSPSFTLSMDETQVYDNVTSLNIQKGYTIRGFYVSQCTLLPNAPSMPLEVTDYRNKAVSADIVQMPVPESSKPAKYTDHACHTSLYRGIQEVRLLAD